MLNALILNFKGHFKGLGVNHIVFLHNLLKRKYEPNTYMLISQTKISAKTMTIL